MNSLANKHLLLIVSGGIAAYKSLELVRRARDRGAQVQVVMTDAAREFVTPLSFQALTANPVHTDLLDATAEAGMGHIELARWADLILVAPATANFIARLAHGLADDLATTVVLASKAPLLIAPAMNQQMWANDATQHNCKQLIQRGVRLVGPDEGSQACGDVGAGRMVEVEALLDACAANWNEVTPRTELAGFRVLITAGPTQEAIDPVRYVSNRSSGKMGYSIAWAAADAGARVDLVSRPTRLEPPAGCAVHAVVSAAEMYSKVMELIESSDIFIACAAVADYTIETPEARKRKKTNTDLSLTLAPTQDILKAVAALDNGPFSVGFAAETDNVVENARLKLKKKSLDMIAANDVSNKNIGFDSDSNELTVLWDDGALHLATAPKDQLARQLVALIAERFRAEQAD